MFRPPNFWIPGAATHGQLDRLPPHAQPGCKQDAGHAAGLPLPRMQRVAGAQPTTLRIWPTTSLGTIVGLAQTQNENFRLILLRTKP